MCGIFGAVEWERPMDAAAVVRATDSLRHRGPDESGFLFDHVKAQELSGRACRFLQGGARDAWQLGLGHRRLSILDLATGQQPMTDASGSWAIIFNGEIYNHAEPRSDLAKEGAKFLTDHSDTETLLLAFARWGPAVLRRLNGMCAAAIYHRDTGRLWLIRDRFGKKPLYFLHGGGRLIFGSELKALVDYLGAPPPLNWDALGDYMMRSCIHEPRSIFEGVLKVPAASFVEFDLRTPGGRLVRQERYWEFQPPDAIDDSRSEADWLVELEHLLDDAVKIRLLSDVPVGAFLSGGLDSATVCALAAKHVREPLRAYTIGTEDPKTDESADAAQVAATLGLRHTAEKGHFDARSALTQMVTVFDEPFADISMLPTHQVAQIAAREVKVVLTGDGADEFFAGYGVFGLMTSRTKLERVPLLSPVARGIGRCLPFAGPGGGFIARNFGGNGLERYRGAVESPSMLQLLNPDVAQKINPAWPRLEELWRRSEKFDPLLRISLLQGMTYLPDDILVKADRATMAHSLEGRAPFLDYRVVELMARMPARLKIVDGRGKHILRRLAERWFPTSYLNKPKRGFIIPLKKWLREEMAGDLEDLRRSELFAGGQLPRLLSLQRRSRRHDFSPALWRLLVLHRWMQHWRPP